MGQPGSDMPPLASTPILGGTGRVQPRPPLVQATREGPGVGRALQGDPSPSAPLGPAPLPAMQQLAPWPLHPAVNSGVSLERTRARTQEGPEGSQPPTAQVPPQPRYLQPPAPHAASRTQRRAAAPLLRPPALLPRRRAPHSCPHPGADGWGNLPACLFSGARHAAARQGAGGGCPGTGAGNQVRSSSSPPTGPAPGQPTPGPRWGRRRVRHSLASRPALAKAGEVIHAGQAAGPLRWPLGPCGLCLGDGGRARPVVSP